MYIKLYEEFSQEKLGYERCPITTILDNMEFSMNYKPLEIDDINLETGLIFKINGDKYYSKNGYKNVINTNFIIGDNHCYIEIIKCEDSYFYINCNRNQSGYKYYDDKGKEIESEIILKNDRTGLPKKAMCFKCDDIWGTKNCIEYIIKEFRK